MRNDCLDAAINPKFQWFRRKRAIAAAFLARGFNKIAQALLDCHEVKHQMICASCAETSYVLDRCRKRICPLCAFLESRDRAKLVLALTRSCAHVRMLTLTMPRWLGPPKEGIQFLRRAFLKLRQTKCMSSVKGGVYQIELIAKPSGWHIHLHAILESNYIPWQLVKREWSNIIGCVSASIDIKAAHTDAEKLYVCKYASKSFDYNGNLEDVVDWYEAVRGSRLYAFFGAWYNRYHDSQYEEDNSYLVSPCPHCGAVKSIMRVAYLRYCIGGRVADVYEATARAAGPPVVDAW